MTFGEKIQKERKEAGLSQEELAEQLGVSRQAVSKWENDSGYPEMEKIIRLSQLYQVSLDYLMGNERQREEKKEAEGWYVSHEMAENFLAYQKRKFNKIGICVLLACISGMFSFFGIYNRIGYGLSTLLSIIVFVVISSMVVSENPYRKIWSQPLVFDEEVLKRLRGDFAGSKNKYKGMLLCGLFVFLAGFLLLPEFYWIVPEDAEHLWYAAADAVCGIGGYFAAYAWGIQRAYRVLTMNEEYRRKKKK